MRDAIKTNDFKKYCANAVTTPKGVSIHLGIPCEKIVLDIYDNIGRLVYTKAAANVQKSTAMLLPMNMKALPPGHFVGCVRCFTGGKRVNSVVFSLNTIR